MPWTATEPVLQIDNVEKKKKASNHSSDVTDAVTWNIVQKPGLDQYNRGVCMDKLGWGDSSFMRYCPGTKTLSDWTWGTWWCCIWSFGGDSIIVYVAHTHIRYGVCHDMAKTAKSLFIFLFFSFSFN